VLLCLPMKFLSRTPKLERKRIPISDKERSEEYIVVRKGDDEEKAAVLRSTENHPQTLIKLSEDPENTLPEEEATTLSTEAVCLPNVCIHLYVAPFHTLMEES